MADEKMVSEKETVLRQRAAFVTGWRCGWACNADTESGAISKAAQEYPLPKVPRTRVAIDGERDAWRWTPEYGLEWATSWDGVIVGDWSEAEASMINEVARLVVADLLTNPTEEVDA